MSLYNLLFGHNPFAGVLLTMLGTEPNSVPRFRDCYLAEDGKIVIYTRTGGGNREAYENADSRRTTCGDIYPTEEEVTAGPFNDDLRALPGFLYDEDDGYDSTYARFYFSVPEKFEHLLAKIEPGEDPTKRWADMLAKLKTASPDDPQLKKLTEAFKPVLDAIQKGKGGTFEV